jgi:hypothetical protein
MRCQLSEDEAAAIMHLWSSDEFQNAMRPRHACVYMYVCSAFAFIDAWFQALCINHRLVNFNVKMNGIVTSGC